ncbi:hypothetical protein [Arthrobacter sp. 754]|uniref:hypothetical protein n=1 Tax=Arthrobacter sp. 754 TaxID=3156315 RepID=UPI0033977AE2
MCYSSMEDYGWRARKDAKPKSEPRQETPPDRQEPHYTAQDFSFWAFPRRRKTHEAQEPAAERTHEKV